MTPVTVDHLSAEQLQELERAVEQFDGLCRAARGHNKPLPAVDPFVAGVSEPVRPDLRTALLAILREYGPPGVPGYQLLEQLGHGGMGVVYRARATDGVVAAVKLIDRMDAVRFERLREIWTGRDRLNHPNIAEVTHLGTHAGRVFLVMALIEGKDGKRDLARRADEFTLDPQAAPNLTEAQIHERKIAIVRIMEKVARAVHHLHQRAIMHRDLKPANILLDDKDEPRVCDLDLACPVDAQGFTQSGVLLGTLGYMAPEQLADQDDLTVAVDIWGLGSVLYTLLVGHPPFYPRGTTLRQLLQRASTEHPVPPSGLNRRLRTDSDLEWICLRCLDRDPDQRPSARELADWLRLYQRGQRVRPPETVSHVVKRWLGENLRRPMVEPEYLARWGKLLRIEAGTTLLCHVGMFALAQTGVMGWWLWLWFLTMDTLLSWLIWLPAYLGRRLSPMEREVMQLWSGADLAAAVLLMAMTPFARPLEPADLGHFYSAYAAIRGLIFFIEGRVCWDRLYAPGVVFFLAAVVMRLVPAYAPLIHGTLYSCWFVCLSLMMSRQRTERPESAQPGTPCSTVGQTQEKR